MKNFSPLRLAIALSVALVCVTIHAIHNDLPASHAFLELLGFAALGASFSGGFGVQDANQSSTLALPSATNTAVTTATGLDTMASPISDFLAKAEVLITAPALNTTQLPNAATMSYSLVASNNSNMAGPVTIFSNCLVQTGAGGAGAAAATERVRLPTNLGGSYGRYLGITITPVSATNCSAAKSTTQLLF